MLRSPIVSRKAGHAFNQFADEALERTRSDSAVELQPEHPKLSISAEPGSRFSVQSGAIHLGCKGLSR
jgi:hypothetical protein